MRDSLFKNTKSYWSLINKTIDLILKRALKSKKKYKKRADDILELAKLPSAQLA